MNTLYVKNKYGEYVPFVFSPVDTKEWNNKLVTVKVGTEDYVATSEDLEDIVDLLSKADAISDLCNTSFFVTTHKIDFEVSEKREEVE